MKLSVDRDIPLLKFLWKWKVVSTNALAARFYPNSTLRAPYLRFWVLEQGGFIKALSSENGRGFVWTLGKKGYDCIRSSLPRLTEDGFKSEHVGHDIVVSAAHLGEWIGKEPSGVELFSEQELRRCDSELFPDWLPEPELHRPDGYWYFKNSESPRLLALEVELSQKQLDFYDNVARFYDQDTEDCHVIWIVDGQSLVKRIHERITKAIGSTKGQHSFVLFEHFQQTQWQSKIMAGKNAGRTIRQTLQMYLRYASDEHLSWRFFDFRKNPTVSATNKISSDHNFFNCVAPLPNFNSQRIISL